MDYHSNKVDLKLTDDLVADIMASKEPKMTQKRTGFALNKELDPTSKMSYLSSIYRADASILGEQYRKYRSTKSELPVSSSKLSNNDINNFKETLNNRIYHGEKAFQTFVDQTNDIVNKAADQFERRVMDQEYKGREGLKQFTNGVKNNRLIKEDIYISEDLWQKNKSVQFMEQISKDPAGDILVDAFRRYHQKSLQGILKKLSKQLVDQKLGNNIYQKRMGLGELLRYVSEHLKQPSVRFSEIVDPNCKDEFKYGYNDFYAKEPTNKIMLPLIDPALEEANSMDKILPSIVNLLVHKANHYLAHINPSIQNTYNNFLESTNSFQANCTFTPGNTSTNEHNQYLSRTLNNLAALPPSTSLNKDYRVADISTIKSGPLSLKIVNQMYNTLKENAQNQIFFFEMKNLNDVMTGGKFYATESVNVEDWIIQAKRLENNTSPTQRKCFAFIVGGVHGIFAEINSGGLNTFGHANRNFAHSLGKEKEIVIYDSNHREYRYVHNSIFLILRRFIYLELQSKSQRSQAECYDECLSYKFRRAIVPQEISTMVRRGINPDAFYYFLKNCQIVSEGGNPEGQSFSLEDVATQRLQIFDHIDKGMYGQYPHNVAIQASQF